MESLLVQAARPTGRPQRRREDPEGSEPPRGDALALILSPQGDFVRGIVVEELSKGADAAWRVAADSLLDGVKGELTGASAATATAAGPLLKTLLDVLAVAPTLADREDTEQLDGLQRLGRALQAATVAQKEADEQRRSSREGGRPSVSSTWMSEGTSSSSSSFQVEGQIEVVVVVAVVQVQVLLLQMLVAV
jgi:hypothetical protein